MTYPTDNQLATAEKTETRSSVAQDGPAEHQPFLGGSIPSQGSPPTYETIPEGPLFERPTAPAGLAAPLPADEAPRRSGNGRPALIAVVALAGLIGVVVTIAVNRPVPGPAASTAQPVATMSQPAPTDPSVVAATARAQLNAAYTRLGQAAQQFDQAEQAADKNRDEQASQTAVQNARAAFYDYDQGLRSITFPPQQQAVVNTQLLPATDQVIADLDQLADPATVLQAKSRAVQDGQAIDMDTQQVYNQLGN